MFYRGSWRPKPGLGFGSCVEKYFGFRFTPQLGDKKILGYVLGESVR